MVRGTWTVALQSVLLSLIRIGFAQIISNSNDTTRYHLCVSASSTSAAPFALPRQHSWPPGRHHNTNRQSLILGQTVNVTLSEDETTPSFSPSSTNNPISSQLYGAPPVCQLAFSACYNCVFNVVALGCKDGKNAQLCARILVEETDYPSTRFSLSERWNYTTQSYELLITLSEVIGLRREELLQLFPIRVSALDNTEVIYGISQASPPQSYQDMPYDIVSPNYPFAYRSRLIKNYTLVNTAGGTVRLIFADYQLSAVDHMANIRVIDSDGSEAQNTRERHVNGDRGRPTAFQSTGDRLTVMFTSGPYQQQIGFRAQFAFIPRGVLWTSQPTTPHCDKVFTHKAGHISLDSMQLGQRNEQFVDCVWLIEKPPHRFDLADSIFVKLHNFNIGGGDKPGDNLLNPLSLVIRRGLTSMSPEITTIFGPMNTQQVGIKATNEGFPQGYEIHVDQDGQRADAGFYIRLYGLLTIPKRQHQLATTASDDDGPIFGPLLITFAHYYKWATAVCSDHLDHHCANGRCIQGHPFVCDRYDHCGDWSDEDVICAVDGEPPPRNGGGLQHGSGLGTHNPFAGGWTTIVLVGSLIALTVTMLMATIIVARVYRQKFLRRLDEHHAAVAERSASAGFSDGAVATIGGGGIGVTTHRIGDRRFYALQTATDIPIYEAPPAYSDALKHPTTVPLPRACPVHEPLDIGQTNHGYNNTGFAPNESLELLAQPSPGTSSHPPPSPSQPPYTSDDCGVCDECSVLSGTGSSISSRTSGDSSSSVSTNATLTRLERQHTETGSSVATDTTAPVRRSSAVDAMHAISGILSWARTRVLGANHGSMVGEPGAARRHAASDGEAPNATVAHPPTHRRQNSDGLARIITNQQQAKDTVPTQSPISTNGVSVRTTSPAPRYTPTPAVRLSLTTTTPRQMTATLSSANQDPLSRTNHNQQTVSCSPGGAKRVVVLALPEDGGLSTLPQKRASQTSHRPPVTAQSASPHVASEVVNFRPQQPPLAVAVTRVSSPRRSVGSESETNV